MIFTMRDRFKVAGTYHLNPIDFDGVDVQRMNITSLDGVRRFISTFVPDIIIHCAAETRVDHCEEHPEEAFRVNVEGAVNLVRSGVQVGAKMIYISTDAVFEGDQGGYREEDRTHPINIYAQTKLAGEQAVQEYCNNYLILRTNIYGWNVRPKLSLAEWILDRLEKSDQKVPAFGDIFFAPMLVNHLAQIIEQMIQADLRGLFHIGARDKCSKLDFARMICQVFDKQVESILPSSSEVMHFKACRPKDTSLDVSKVTNTLGEKMPSVIDGLTDFRKLLENGYVARLRSRSTGEETRS